MPIRVAYQGEPGAYSEQAAYQYFGTQITCVACPNFQALPQSLDEGSADYAVIPIENALAGTVISALDTINSAEIYINGELSLPIHHCLLACKGSNLSLIEQVYSHPQALSQSQQFITQHNFEACAFHDTAGAAAWVARQQKCSYAAIASKLAAERYGLQVLAKHIEDKEFNQTRFLIIDKKPLQNLTLLNKTSLLLTLNHEPNALARVLTQLGEHQCNLTKITSRPNRKIAWEYQFFIEFTWNLEYKEQVTQLLTEVSRHCQSFKSFGHYPAKIGIT
jgi:prephenate dehydratase